MSHQFARLREHIEKLYAFSVVAKAGSISHASLTLKISQAALSHSLKVLEGAVEVPLFTRSSKGMALTPSGKHLFDFSKRLFSDLENVEAAVKNPQQEGAARLRIGTHETLAIHVWPDFLDRLGDQHPNLSISLISGRANELVQGLKNGDYHIIVTIEPAEDRLIAKKVLYQGEFGFFKSASVASRYPELSKRQMSRDDVDRIPILTDAYAEVRQHTSIPAFLVQAGFRLDHFFELNSFEASIQLTARGLGLAFLPKRNAAQAVKAGLIKPVTVAGIPSKGFGKYQICASYLRSSAGNSILERVLQKLESDFL